MWGTLDVRELLGDELVERRQNGYNLGGLAPRIEAALGEPEVADADLEQLYEQLERTETAPGWGYYEPSGFAEMSVQWPAAEPAPKMDEAEVADRIEAAWRGRCAGCTLGKPVEGGWGREKLRRCLDMVGAFPLADYVPVPELPPDEFALHPSWPEVTRGRVKAMARDDDIDYTIVALRLLERYGPNFNSDDVGSEWLACLPYKSIYTSERVAYRNLVCGYRPPQTASRRNPYRQSIGATIRGDMFGYVSPGDPRRAAEMAYQDAALSHTANGIYGEVWASALVAAAARASDAQEALAVALCFVPAHSRLAKGLRATIAAHAEGRSWDDAMASLEMRLAGLPWVHTLNNVEVVAAALLWGEGDLARTIGLAVEAGLDTDCTGATAGSVFGALHGTAAIPPHWTKPLADTVHSAIFGFDGARISDLVARTVGVWRR